MRALHPLIQTAQSTMKALIGIEEGKSLGRGEGDERREEKEKGDGPGRKGGGKRRQISPKRGMAG